MTFFSKEHSHADPVLLTLITFKLKQIIALQSHQDTFVGSRALNTTNPASSFKKVKNYSVDIEITLYFFTFCIIQLCSPLTWMLRIGSIFFVCGILD